MNYAPIEINYTFFRKYFDFIKVDRNSRIVPILIKCLFIWFSSIETKLSTFCQNYCCDCKNKPWNYDTYFMTMAASAFVLNGLDFKPLIKYEGVRFANNTYFETELLIAFKMHLIGDWFPSRKRKISKKYITNQRNNKTFLHKQHNEKPMQQI